MSDRSFALLGSGEFEPWTEPIDRWALGRAAAAGAGDGRVLILPAASAPEGDAVFDMWADMGLTHYGRLGIEAEVVPIKSRQDADRPGFVQRLGGAAMAFFSGGNPSVLAQILAGSRFWAALVEALDSGMAYAGCSAGVACLGEVAPDSAATSFEPDQLWRPGLRLFPKTYFGPHWDALDSFVPGLRDLIIGSVPADCRLLAIDEHTAVLGDGAGWTVSGMGGAYVYEGGARTDYPAGSPVTLDLRPDLSPAAADAAPA